jgi:hypothetical protein
MAVNRWRTAMSALSLSNTQSKSSIAVQWIGAHLLAQVVCIATALLMLGIAKVLGIATGPMPSYLSVAFALMLAMEAIFIAASAWLRGSVLRRVLPRFEMAPWMIVVALYMLAFALLSGFSTRLPAVDTTPQAASMTTSALMNGAMIATIMGALVGLLVGGLEALVIRRAAEGAGLWVLMTMVAWGAMLAMLTSSSMLLVALGATTGMAALAGGVALKFGSAMLMAVLTLPAVLHITPRMIEPSPASATGGYAG